MTFVILVPEGSALVMLRSHRINRVMVKEVDATLYQHFAAAAGLIQHLTSPYSILPVVFPKTSGGVQITVNSEKRNQSSSVSQVRVLYVDKVLDTLRKDGCFP